ncbi:hypothetical protein BBJ28_00015956 [Nothophytophthora sp. Chile5]|nr:hypothetical protein BBJ28_00015956 [Nothophytophthora sp. Chile5]
MRLNVRVSVDSIAFLQIIRLRCIIHDREVHVSSVFPALSDPKTATNSNLQCKANDGVKAQLCSARADGQLPATETRGMDTALGLQRLERLSYVVSSAEDKGNEAEEGSIAQGSAGRDLQASGKRDGDDDVGYEAILAGDPLRSGDVPNLFHWRYIGLLVQYAAVGVLYGGLPRTVYPFLNNYLHLNGYQTLSARVLLSLPWSFKVVIGIVSDCFPILRSRRRAYMVVGWLVCSGMLLTLVFVPQEPPFYMDPSLRGKDLSMMAAKELQGRVNWRAPDSASLYIVLLMLAGLGYMIADVASDGLVVEFAQREPESIRGNIQSTVYLVRSIAMIVAALLVGFGLNSEDYGGSFTWSLSMSQLMLICSLLSLVAIPAAVWLVHEPPIDECLPKVADYLRGLWTLLQNTAMVQILAYRFFSGIFDGFTITATDPIQRYWAHVHPLNESLFAVLGLLVFSLALYVTKRVGLGWSWRRVIAWTTVAVVVLDAVVGMLTVWDVLRSQWFWLGTPILEELPQAMSFLVSTFVVVEMAERGNEAAVYGLLTTVANLANPFAACISKNVNALFDVGVADIIRDSTHVRWQVTWTILLAYTMKLLSLAWLPLLPRQKRETQELKRRAGSWFWGGVATVTIFGFALVWSVATNLLSIFPGTSCLVLTDDLLWFLRQPAAEGATKEGQKAPDALVLTPYEKVSATATGGFWLGLISLGAVGVYFVARELLPNIKYNIKGPTGHAYVFAEVNQGMKKNEYVYLIVQITKTGELLKIIDNRQILAAETKEEQDALRQLLGKY